MPHVGLGLPFPYAWNTLRNCISASARCALWSWVERMLRCKRFLAHSTSCRVLDWDRKQAIYDWRAASASAKLLASTAWRNVSAQWVRLGDVILGTTRSQMR